jgi:hypothetical protein
VCEHQLELRARGQPAVVLVRLFDVFCFFDRIHVFRQSYLESQILLCFRMLLSRDLIKLWDLDMHSKDPA